MVVVAPSVEDRGDFGSRWSAGSKDGGESEIGGDASLSEKSSDFGDWKIGGCVDSSVAAPSGEDEGVEAASKGTQSGGIVMDPVESGCTVAWSSYP